MENEKLREIKLSKASKYTILTAFLIAVITGGVMSSYKRNSDTDEVVNNENVIEEDNKEEEITIIVEEKLMNPYSVKAEIKTYYYDLNDDSATREKALIYYNGSYTPSNGVDYYYKDTNFDVVSAFSGKVIDKKVDSMFGASLYIKHDNGLVAVYSSLTDIKVNIGDEVKQGDIIARAGNNTINSGIGNHLNFSLLKEGKYINPINNFSKNIKDI